MSAEGRWLFDPLAWGMGGFTRWVASSKCVVSARRRRVIEKDFASQRNPTRSRLRELQPRASLTNDLKGEVCELQGDEGLTSSPQHKLFWRSSRETSVNRRNRKEERKGHRRPQTAMNLIQTRSGGEVCELGACWPLAAGCWMLDAGGVTDWRGTGRIGRGCGMSHNVRCRWSRQRAHGSTSRALCG